jgi:phosphatidylinositol alpha-1,6-mannosyltransferase
MTRKGQDKLIKALPSVLKLVPFASLIIVGDGPYRKHLEKLTDDLGLRDNVHFTGKVDQDQLANWYAAGDVFAMPCRTRVGGWDVEGLGIVFLEASATGLPVVVGDSGGAVDAVLDGETGFLVNGNNVSEISDRLSQLLLDQDLARRMGAAGRNWVMQEWTWEHSFKRLDSLLSGVDVDH